MSETNIRLVYPGDRATHEAIVSPFGASLRSHRVRDQVGEWHDVIWPYDEAAHKQGGQGDVLFPFPSRIPDGKYQFKGKEYQLPCNDKEGHAAIHGFVRSRDWNTIVEAPLSSERCASVIFQLRVLPTHHPGYPFDLNAVVEYQLGPIDRFDDESLIGLACSFHISNRGEHAAPIGIGFHPYFTFGRKVDGLTLTLPSRRALEFGPGFLPTGNVLDIGGSELDFTKPRPIGATQLNHCFEVEQPPLDEEDFVCCVVKGGPRTTMIRLEASVFRYVVAYTGDSLPAACSRQSIAIEPMSCATDAFNHPEWGLRVLEPGAVFGGSYAITSVANQ
jgi:aldose 1-epimerase